MKILFICKKNECYGFKTNTRRSAGLYNSTRFIVESLRDNEIDAKIIEVIDNNCIDREVTEFKPDVVVIEAFWVVPEKFEILKRLHPYVKWCVHLHSHMPFLALEGIAMEWFNEYQKRNITMIANSFPSFEALKVFDRTDSIVFLPNVYIPNFRFPKFYDMNKPTIEIGCFGAVRPLKNQLLQALAAIKFAREIGKPLNFHMNASRMETGGQPVMKNLIHLFDRTENATLIQHPWYEPEEFLDVLQVEIDIGLQVSLTETFNVVTADYVTAGLPVVTSKEVVWVSKMSHAQDDSISDIVKKMHRALSWRCIIKKNQNNLLSYSEKAQDMWLDFVSGLFQ